MTATESPATWTIEPCADVPAMVVQVPENTWNDDHRPLPAATKTYLVLTNGRHRVCLRAQLMPGGEFDTLHVNDATAKRMGARAVVTFGDRRAYQRTRLFGTGAGRVALVAFLLGLLATGIEGAFAIGKAQRAPTVTLGSGAVVFWQFVAALATLVAAAVLFGGKWFVEDADE